MTSPERLSPPQKSFDNTLAFLKEMGYVPWKKSNTPNDHYPPKPDNQPDEVWAVIQEVMVRYNLGNERWRAIALPGLSRETARKLNRKGIEILYKISPLSVQELHPIESFSFKKPKPRKPLAIRELFNPREEHKKNLELLLDPKLKKKRVQEILDQVTESEYQSRSKGENPLFISVSKIAKKAGLFVPAKEVAAIAKGIRKKGIPIGFVERVLLEKQGRKQTVFRHYFTLARYENPALHKFRTDADFEKRKFKPVISIGRHANQIPNTYELISGHYSSVGNLCRELGYLVTPIAILITPDCPAPVFKYKNSLFYDKSQREILERFLRHKIRKLIKKPA